jgi:hypothetical protein
MMFSCNFSSYNDFLAEIDFNSHSTPRPPHRASGFFLTVLASSAHRSANTMRYIVTNLAAQIRDVLPRRFSELAVFNARLYIRIRRIDEPA